MNGNHSVEVDGRFQDDLLATGEGHSAEARSFAAVVLISARGSHLAEARSSQDSAPIPGGSISAEIGFGRPKAMPPRPVFNLYAALFVRINYSRRHEPMTKLEG